MNSLVFLTTLARAIAYNNPTDSDADMKLNMFGCDYGYIVLHLHELRPKHKRHTDKERAWTLVL
jgi:hypothetical protein